MNFDKQGLLSKFDNDIELISEILALFITSSKELIEKMTVGQEVSDADAIARAAHSLKGAASNFSSELVTKVASELESCGKENNLVNVDALLDQLRIEVGQLIIHVESSTKQ